MQSSKLRDAVFRGMTAAITQPDKDRLDLVHAEVKAFLVKELNDAAGLANGAAELKALKSIYAKILTEEPPQ